jgi:hypothetical protein
MLLLTHLATPENPFIAGDLNHLSPCTHGDEVFFRIPLNDG